MTRCAAPRLRKPWRIPVDTTQARRSCSLATSISMRPQGLPPHRSVRRSFRMYLRIITYQQRLARFWIPDERSIGSLRGDRFAPANPGSLAPCPLPTTTLFRSPWRSLRQRASFVPVHAVGLDVPCDSLRDCSRVAHTEVEISCPNLDCGGHRGIPLPVARILPRLPTSTNSSA